MPEYVELPKGHKFTAAQRRERIAWAHEFIATVRPVAKELGYGIAELGSKVRDVDIIAVPWEAPTSQIADAFVLELVRRLGLQMGNRGTTVFGHAWYALWHPERPDHQIDLKVIRPAHNYSHLQKKPPA